jgi:hypothetical protein
MKEYKLTQKQFDWLIDTANSRYKHSIDICNTASKLLKAYGFQGWYDVNGKMALQMLTDMVRNEKKQKKDRVDDLPF